MGPLRPWAMGLEDGLESFYTYSIPSQKKCTIMKGAHAARRLVLFGGRSVK